MPQAGLAMPDTKEIVISHMTTLRDADRCVGIKNRIIDARYLSEEGPKRVKLSLSGHSIDIGFYAPKRTKLFGPASARSGRWHPDWSRTASRPFPYDHGSLL